LTGSGNSGLSSAYKTPENDFTPTGKKNKYLDFIYVPEIQLDTNHVFLKTHCYNPDCFYTFTIHIENTPLHRSSFKIHFINPV